MKPADSDYFTYPPTGGPAKLVLLGLLLPGFIGYHALHVWIIQETIWPDHARSRLVFHGEAARAMAVVYLSLAALIHFRWFWGMLQADRTFKAGTVLSLMLFVGAAVWVLCDV